MKIKLVRDGRFRKKVLFDSELVGTIDQTTEGLYYVHSRKGGASVCQSLDEAIGVFTKWDWRSVLGASPLKMLPPPKYEPHSVSVTKQRWAQS